MSYVGSSYKRDVALVEPSLTIDEFEKPLNSKALVGKFISFSGDDAKDIESFEVKYMSVRGQSVEPGVFHVSTAKKKGSYVVESVINDENVNFAIELDGTVDINYEYELGKKIVSELPQASKEISFDGGNKSVLVTINGGSGLKLSVEFDAVGAPDMTWDGEYEFNYESKLVMKNSIMRHISSVFTLALEYNLN